MGYVFSGVYFTKKSLNARNPLKLYEETTEFYCKGGYITVVGHGYYTKSDGKIANFGYTGIADYPHYNSDGTGEILLGDDLVFHWTDILSSEGTEKGRLHRTIVRIDKVDDATGVITDTSTVNDMWIGENGDINSVPCNKHGFGSWKKGG